MSEALDTVLGTPQLLHKHSLSIIMIDFISFFDSIATVEEKCKNSLYITKHFEVL